MKAFLPDAITQLPTDKLKKRGLKIPDRHLQPNGLSLKDAVIEGWRNRRIALLTAFADQPSRCA